MRNTLIIKRVQQSREKSSSTVEVSALLQQDKWGIDQMHYPSEGLSSLSACQGQNDWNKGKECRM